MGVCLCTSRVHVPLRPVQVFFQHTLELNADQHKQLVARSIGIVGGPVRRLVIEDDRLVGAELADGRTVPRRDVFVRPCFVADNDLLVGLGCALGGAGWVATDCTGRTASPASESLATLPPRAPR